MLGENAVPLGIDGSDSGRLSSSSEQVVCDASVTDALPHIPVAAMAVSRWNPRLGEGEVSPGIEVVDQNRPGSEGIRGSDGRRTEGGVQENTTRIPDGVNGSTSVLVFVLCFACFASAGGSLICQASLFPRYDCYL